MINTRKELNDYIREDAMSRGRKKLSASFFGDEMWKFQLCMRKLDYYATKRKQSLFAIPLYAFYRLRYHNLSVKLSLSIPYNVCGKGLVLPHYGCIFIHENAKIGNNCRILHEVSIGGTNGSTNAPCIGNNVFIAPGAKIFGDITIADNVAIGTNAVVIKSITEPGTTWAGIPAKKISNNSSASNLNQTIAI